MKDTSFQIISHQLSMDFPQDLDMKHDDIVLKIQLEIYSQSEYKMDFLYVNLQIDV